MTIPIENIYFLLCYAWDKLDERDIVSVQAQEHTQLLDLLTRVLLNGTTYLLKRGIDRQYLPQQHAYAGVKGKFLLGETLKHPSLMATHTQCEFDEFSVDILHNQLLYTTLRHLLRCEDVHQGLHQSIRSLLPKLSGIQEVTLSERLFQSVRLHRNNAFYGFLMNCCELIHQNLLLNEQTGKYRFRDFWQDERQMARLFEAFVRNFYKRELSDARVYREDIRWQMEATATDLSLLPKMQTDISIEWHNRKTLIDTKFYSETLRTYFDAQKIHAPHLYQLFAYLQNHPDAQEGILLYPVVSHQVGAAYQRGTQRIRVETIHLAQPWQSIREDLLRLVG
ncbi:MAG: hypothetical protein U0Y10_02875 [Spirosomataceae bacterium]